MVYNSTRVAVQLKGKKDEMQLLRIAAFTGEHEWDLPALFHSHRVKTAIKRYATGSRGVGDNTGKPAL
jgi:hypothetical protein